MKSLPFTPFHIGHAILTYAIFNSLDFIALLYGSILIDIEPFLIISLGLPYPLHGPIHSILGVLIITPAIYLATFITKFFILKLGFPLEKAISNKVILVSILVGGYSHIILDAFLYPEMNLAWPFPYWNPLLNVFSSPQVYGFCVFSFFAGGLLYVVRKVLFREKV